MATITRNALELYTLEKNRIFIAPSVIGGAVVAGEFLWDKILSKVIDEVIAEIGKGIGSEITSRLFGSTSPWEKNVTSQLQTVIHQLNEILLAIRALGPLIRAELLQSLQERLDAEITGGAESIAQIVTIIRTVGLTDETRLQLRLHVVDLTSDVNSLLEYKEIGNEARPLGLPLYAVASAGLVMIVVAQRILGTDLGASAVKHACSKFDEWISYIDSQLLPLVQSAETEITFLNSVPHRAPLGYANYERLDNGEPANFVGNAVPWWTVYAVIEGSADQPFKFIQTEFGPLFEPTPENRRGPPPGEAQLPPPSEFRRPRGMFKKMYPNGYIFYMPALIDALNGRRTSLFTKLDEIKDLQRVRSSLYTSQIELKRLLG